MTVTYEIVQEIVAGRLKHCLYRVNGNRKAFLGSFESERAAQAALDLILKSKGEHHA